MLQWCETLHVKYSDLLGTQKYHDIACLNDQYVHVVTKVRESCCSSGSFSRSPLKINNASATAWCNLIDNYKTTVFRDLSAEEVKDMKFVYGQFIPPDRQCPDYLPPFVSSVVINTTSRRSSSGTTSSGPSTVPPPAKQLCEQSSSSTLG